MSASCLYEGTVRHRRLDPPREFRHQLALTYIDLDELPRLLGGRLVSPRPGLVRFRRRDYLGDRREPLAEAVARRVEKHTELRQRGPIRLLTHLRSFGHCFNPVSFYYCFDPDGERLRAVVAEVTNTPWGERHAYVMSAPAQGPPVIEASFHKALHVSPFMGMDQRYLARAATPGQTLSVHIENHRGATLEFDATLSLVRRPLTRRTLADATARYPAATVRVLALIYGHALGLALAGVSLRPHPSPGAP